MNLPAELTARGDAPSSVTAPVAQLHLEAPCLLNLSSCLGLFSGLHSSLFLVYFLDSSIVEAWKSFRKSGISCQRIAYMKCLFTRIVYTVHMSVQDNARADSDQNSPVWFTLARVPLFLQKKRKTYPSRGDFCGHTHHEMPQCHFYANAPMYKGSTVLIGETPALTVPLLCGGCQSS